MKKVLNVFSVLLIILPVLLISCSKVDQGKYKEQIPANDLKLARMIQNFKVRGESKLKSDEEMSIDSALWYLSATANFTYGNVSHETEKIFIDSVFITLPISNGKIAESEVFNKYQSIVDSLQTIYNSINEENRQLLSVGISTHNLTSNSIVCKVVATFAYDYPVALSCTFGDVNSYCFYYYWQYHSICNGNTGSTEITDAAEETQKLIMRCRAIPAGTYWTENEYEVPILDPTVYPINPNAPISNYRYAHLYWNSSQYTNPGINGCIPPEDLNFYLDKTKDLIYTETSQGGLRKPGYNFLSIDIWGFIDNNYYTIYEHQANVKYGIIHMSPYPPVPIN